MAPAVRQKQSRENGSLNMSEVTSDLSSVTEMESLDVSGVSDLTSATENEMESLEISGVLPLTSVTENDSTMNTSGVSTHGTSVIRDRTIVNETLNASKVSDGAGTSNSESTSPDAELYGDFNDSRDAISSNVPAITKEMIAEEMKHEQERVRDELKQQKEHEAKIAEKEKAARYEKLIVLLNKSKFYGKFIADRLLGSVESAAEKEKKAATKKGRKKKNQPVESISEENIDPASQGPTNSQESANSQEPTNGDEQKNSQENTPLGSNSRKRKFKDSPKSDECSRPTKVSKEEEEEETYVTAQGITASVRQPKLFDGGCLRDYQLDGLDWLKALFENGVNGILADEMGLGKTAQVIAFICHLIEMGGIGPFLIIGPLSTLPNWLMEFDRFAPQVPVLLFHGYKGEREALRSKFYRSKEVNGKKIFPVILTSYEIPLMERKHMRQFVWKFIIVDEGHRLKNHCSQLAVELRAYNSINRLLLTGTPLQNGLSELWALLNFLLPELFNDLNTFESWLDLSILSNNGEALIEQEKSNQIVATLQQILAPFMLRRRKVDVEINIPPKKELLVYAPMTTLQQDLYKATIDHTIAQLLGYEQNKLNGHMIPDNPDGTKAKRSCVSAKKNYSFPSLNWYIEQDTKVFDEPSITVVDKDNKDYKITIRMQKPEMQLRKIVNHPFLIQMPLIPGTREIMVNEDLITKSGKLLVLDAMLAKLKERGHKVLLFSTFCMVLDLLEEYMLLRGYKYERLDGGCNIQNRMKSIKSFNTDPDVFVFLISTRAGGLGINLTAADTVVIFDSDWNPQNDLQAQDRCHRIGQTRPVVVYRFATAGTVDERIVEVAGAKRKLEKLVIQDGNFINAKSIMKPTLVNLQSLKELLESRDYQKKIQPNGYIFTDEELDALLDRSDLVGKMKGALKPSNSIFKVIQTEETE